MRMEIWCLFRYLLFRNKVVTIVVEMSNLVVTKGVCYIENTDYSSLL